MTTTVTRAEELEADIRRAMAALPAADWEHRSQRRDDLVLIDVMLDAWADAVRV